MLASICCDKNVVNVRGNIYNNQHHHFDRIFALGQYSTNHVLENYRSLQTSLNRISRVKLEPSFLKV